MSIPADANQWVTNSPHIAFEIANSAAKPVLTIMPDGRVFWRDHEVKSDRDFRKVMRELLKYLQGGCAHKP